MLFVISDLKNIVRSKAFIRLIFVTLLFPVFVFPSEYLNFRSLIIDEKVYAQFAHISWLPVTVAYCATIVFPIFCIGYSKNLLTSDTDKFPLMFTANFSSISYVIGKYFSCIIQLLTILFVLIVGTLFVSIINFPISEFSFYSFFSPFIVLIAPSFLFLAVTMLVDIICCNKNINIVINLLIFLFIFILTMSVPMFNGKFDILGQNTIRTSILISGYESSGIYPHSIKPLGSVASDSFIGKKILELNGIFDLNYTIISGLIILLISFLLLVLTCIIFRHKISFVLDKNLFFSKNNKKYLKDRNSILFYLLFTKNITLNLLIIRLFTQFKQNMRSLLFCFAFNFICSITMKSETAQLIFLPISFISYSELLSLVGAQDYKNHFLVSFYAIPQKNLLLISSAVSAFILVVFTNIPFIIMMIQLKQYICIITLIVLIFFFISLSSIFAEVTKNNNWFKILYTIILFVLIVQPKFIIGIHPDYTNYLKIGTLFSISTVLFFISNILRKYTFHS